MPKQEWRVRTNPTKYPDLFTYDILEKNPNAGKSGVPYNGDAFSVALGLDSKENAYLIAAAPDLLEALKAMLIGSEVIGDRVVQRTVPSDKAIKTAWRAIIKSEGK